MTGQTTFADDSRYPLWTTCSPSATPPMTPVTALAPAEISPVDVMGRVLGWHVDPKNPRAFRDALAQAFPVTRTAAGPAVQWRPRSYTVQAIHPNAVPVTGDEASMQERVRVIVNAALPLLDGLEPLACCTDDADVESMRNLVRSDLLELVELFGSGAGVVAPKIDVVFQRLVGYTPGSASVTFADPMTVGGEVGELRQRLGLRADRATTLPRAETLTNFQIVANYIDMLKLSWNAVRTDFDRSGSESLGSAVRQLHLSLLALRESIGELYAVFDSLLFGPAERMTTMLAPPSAPPISVADLLTWTEELATGRNLDLIRSGRDGIVLSVLPAVRTVETLFDAGLFAATRHPALTTDRARTAILKTLQQVTEVRELAEGVAVGGTTGSPGPGTSSSSGGGTSSSSGGGTSGSPGGGTSGSPRNGGSGIGSPDVEPRIDEVHLTGQAGADAFAVVMHPSFETTFHITGDRFEAGASVWIEQWDAGAAPVHVVPLSDTNVAPESIVGVIRGTISAVESGYYWLRVTNPGGASAVYRHPLIVETRGHFLGSAGSARL